MKEAQDTQTGLYVAVLPLQNLSEDPQIEMFCQGLVMDIITDLSRFRSLHIISFDSTKDLHPNERIDGQNLSELQLDYVMKGMVRFRQDKLIFNLQLVNVSTNRLVWAEKVIGSLEEVFRIEEEIVEKIVVSLQNYIESDLITQTRKKSLPNLSAYECWVRGIYELKKGSLEADEKARAYFKKAIEMDPNYPRAYTGMSLSYFNEWSCQIWDRWEVCQNGAFEWAKKAVELDPYDHISLAILGRVYLYNADYEKAEHYLRRSLRLNPNDAEYLLVIAFGLIFLGYPKEAYKLYQKALRLNPSAEGAHSTGGGAAFELGHYEEAIYLWEKRELSIGWVDKPVFLAASYYHLGKMEKVAELWEAFLQNFAEKINGGKPADKETALKWSVSVNPFKDTSKIKPFWEYIAGNTISPYTAPPKENTNKAANRFFKEGELWQLSYAGRQIHTAELKGFNDITRLLAKPQQAFHCTDLAGSDLLERGQEVIDDKAKRTYRKRILELQGAIAEAEANSYAQEVSELHEEYDQLLDHLSKSTGLGGRTRKSSGSVEKARTAVTWRIRSAIRKIAEIHPELGKHLQASIKTGVYCEYNPELEVDWEL